MTNDELLYGEDVSQVLNNLPENISPNELFEKYKYYKNLYLETKKKKDKATCNFWPLVKQTAAYKFLYEYFAELYKNKIDENDYSNIISLKKQEKYYREKTETMLKIINETIENLNIYKPTKYKAVIKILETIKN